MARSLPPGKETRCRRLGLFQDRSGRVRKIFLPPGFFFSEGLFFSLYVFRTCFDFPGLFLCPSSTTQHKYLCPRWGSNSQFQPASDLRPRRHRVRHSIPGPSVRSESLYLLHYPGPLVRIIYNKYTSDWTWDLTHKHPNWTAYAGAVSWVTRFLWLAIWMASVVSDMVTSSWLNAEAGSMRPRRVLGDTPSCEMISHVVPETRDELRVADVLWHRKRTDLSVCL
jgi:hypothetical protein